MIGPEGSFEKLSVRRDDVGKRDKDKKFKDNGCSQKKGR